jgi:hypothetical protein
MLLYAGALCAGSYAQKHAVSHWFRSVYQASTVRLPVPCTDISHSLLCSAAAGSCCCTMIIEAFINMVPALRPARRYQRCVVCQLRVVLPVVLQSTFRLHQFFDIVLSKQCWGRRLQLVHVVHGSGALVCREPLTGLCCSPARNKCSCCLHVGHWYGDF